jgi:hypothetical protein
VARQSLPQLIFVALHAANLGQLLKDVPSVLRGQEARPHFREAAGDPVDGQCETYPGSTRLRGGGKFGYPLKAGQLGVGHVR